MLLKLLCVYVPSRRITAVNISKYSNAHNAHSGKNITPAPSFAVFARLNHNYTSIISAHQANFQPASPPVGTDSAASEPAYRPTGLPHNLPTI